MEVVSATTALDSADAKSTLARCPAGKSVIAGGHDVRDDRVEADRGLGIRVSSAVGQTWFAVAQKLRGTAAPWSLAVYAVCANVTTAPSSPVSNYVGEVSFHQALSPAGSQARAIRANCPKGQQPIGGGAEVQGAEPGTAPPRGVVQIGSSMGFSQGRVPEHWAARGKEAFPTSAIWRLRAWAVCASLRGPGPAPSAQ